MRNNNSDKFDSIKTTVSQNKRNFFINTEYSADYISEPRRRINDLDSSLLEDNAYKDIKNDLFKLEYKISQIDKEIKEIEELITTSEEINDTANVQESMMRLESLSILRNDLLKIYNKKNFSAKIAGSFIDNLGRHFLQYIYVLKDFFIKLEKYLPKSISKLYEMKESINKLENINKSVDKLVSMNSPYGENIDKYKRLSQFIIKSNEIQSELNQHIKSKTE